jgi:uncharacterized protein YbjT (DUF2867 family)
VRVIIFGATGMVGMGVLKECLDDDCVEDVLVIGRRECGERHAKLREIVHDDFFDYSAIHAELSARDTCFFCLGISSVGQDEDSYTRMTHDLTLAAADAFVGDESLMTFVYVSAAGADRSERGRSMWARVRGRVENKLLEMPFRRVYVFRPAYIQPLRNTRSRVFLYRILYAAIGWTYPVLRRLFPRSVTSTVAIGRAMIAVARHGHEDQVLDPAAINAVAGT